MNRLNIAIAIGVTSLFTSIPTASADEWNKKTVVTTSEYVEVPGAVLEPGKYVLRLLDSPSQRHTVQILNERENKVFATTFAIPSQRARPADDTILTFYEMPAGQPQALKAWFYPGDTIGQEFVYPKDRANYIAQATQPVTSDTETVQVAVADTTKNEVSDVDSSMSRSTDTTADADTYVDTLTPSPSADTDSDDALMESPAPAATEDALAANDDEETSDSDSSPTSEMPETASFLPLVGLAGLVSLAAAGGLKLAQSVR